MMIDRDYTVEGMARAFKLYETLTSRQRSFAGARRHGESGIACCNDEYALKWQRINFRVHILKCWLENQPINWFFADWLNNGERSKRNGWTK